MHQDSTTTKHSGRFHGHGQTTQLLVRSERCTAVVRTSHRGQCTAKLGRYGSSLEQCRLCHMDEEERTGYGEEGGGRCCTPPCLKLAYLPASSQVTTHHPPYSSACMDFLLLF